MHGWHRAGHRQPLLDLGQGQVGLGGDQPRQSIPVPGQDPGLPAGVAMAVAEIVGPAPLLQQLLHHADRHPEAPGDLFSRALLRIIGRNNPFPQVQRQRPHPHCMDHSSKCGYSFI